MEFANSHGIAVILEDALALELLQRLAGVVILDLYRDTTIRSDQLGVVIGVLSSMISEEREVICADARRRFKIAGADPAWFAERAKTLTSLRLTTLASLSQLLEDCEKYDTSVLVRGQ